MRAQLQNSFRGAQITEGQNLWNKAMSKVRNSVEWVFGDIVNYFKFVDFHKTSKVQVSAAGKIYMVQNILDYNYQMLRNIFNRHIVNISISLSLPLTWNIWIFVCVSKSNKAGLFEGSLSWGDGWMGGEGGQFDPTNM